MKTLADHSRAYRQRKAERLARLEGALREIAAMRVVMDGGSIAECRRIARQALEGTKS